MGNLNSVEPRLAGQNYMKHYATLKEYADDCAISRFRGGMHFENSLAPGERMCTTERDFTNKAVAYNKFMWTGNTAFLEPFGGLSAFGATRMDVCGLQGGALDVCFD